MTQGLPTFKTVLLEVEGTVATLTLNRPDAVSYTHLTLPTKA